MQFDSGSKFFEHNNYFFFFFNNETSFINFFGASAIMIYSGEDFSEFIKKKTKKKKNLRNQVYSDI